MRSWETKDIIDILIEHHKGLLASMPSSIEEEAEATEVDDKCIVIENFLEDTFGIEWDGLCFRDSHCNKI